MADKNSRSAPLRTAWALTKPYFTSRGAWKAWLLVAAMVAAVVGRTAVDVAFANWDRIFFNAAQSMDKATFLHQLFIFPLLVAVIVGLEGVKYHANLTLRLRWREWLTSQCLSLWMKDQAYFRLRWVDASTDNPDQRISEDLASFVDRTVTILLDVLQAVLNFFAFAGVLWRLSDDVTLWGIHFPRLVFWVCVAYAVVTTALVHGVGRPIIKLDYERERREADFRYSLIRLRENAESIAMYGGEKVERRILDRRFASLVDNVRALIRRQVAVFSATWAVNNAATAVPWIVMAGPFFAGKIQFGDVMQAGTAFRAVRSSLSVIIDDYRDIAAWRATVQRIAGFAGALREVEVSKADDAPPASIRLALLAGDVPGSASPATASGIDLADAEDHTLRVIDVRSHTPEGEPIAAGVSFDLAPREHVLLSGPSGCGKTTLLRAIAGIWPHGSGRIERPPVPPLFLPQRPYLPIGSLRDALCYPQVSTDVEDARVRSALTDVGLGRLAPRLDDIADWSQILSLGEQQRIAFARVLVNAPKLVVLDEATSALDAPAERRMYALMRERLPDAIVLSVGHRDTLEALHDRKIPFPVA